VIDLRTAEECEASAVAPLLARWAYEAGAPYEEWRFGGEAPARAILKEWVFRPSSEVAARRWIIAFREEEPVGGYAAMLGTELATARRSDLLALAGSAGDKAALRDRLAAVSDLFLPVEANELYLGRIAVEKAVRGLGIGTQLMSAVIGDAVRIGATAVRLDVSADNRPAIALNRSAGFETVSEQASERAGLSYLAMRRTV
jgi:ribosomal protein S18 acetylase RimI-like enzyme